MLKTSAEGVEFVFTVMDLTIVLLIMIVTIIWFQSKYLERFYEACKVNCPEVKSLFIFLLQNGDLELVAEHLDSKVRDHLIPHGKSGGRRLVQVEILRSFVGL